VLANIYLHRFDEWYSQHYAAPDQETDRRGYQAWKKQRRKGSNLAAVQMFRYADDWIVVIRGTQAQAQDIKETCKTFLRDELGLELSDEKTKITHIEDGFEFLGFRMFRCNKPSNGRKVGVFMQPTEKGLKRVQAKIKAMTTRSSINDDYVYKIQAINAVIRGWATYYRAVNPTETFQKLDCYVWLRLKKWLEKKYGIGPKEVKRRYMPHQPGPKGGRDEFAAKAGRWDMGLALSSDPNQTHLSSTDDQEALAPSVSGKGESRAVCPTNDERYVAGKQRCSNVCSQSKGSSQKGKWSLRTMWTSNEAHRSSSPPGQVEQETAAS
jgi:RNA-directed DNA polymerase